MLKDFFVINFPYGLLRNEKKQWTAFNREYMPLGFNKEDFKQNISLFDSLPIHTPYKGITKKLLIKLSIDTSSIEYDEHGKIRMLFLYNSLTLPTSSDDNWANYMVKLKILAKLKTDR